MPTQGIAVPGRQETSQAASFTPGQFRFPSRSRLWQFKGTNGSFRPKPALNNCPMLIVGTGHELPLSYTKIDWQK